MKEWMGDFPVQDRVDALKLLLRCHSYLYYTLADTIISDSVFDVLFNTLKQLEKENPALLTADSPTQLVGIDISLMHGSGKTKADVVKMLRTVGKNVKPIEGGKDEAT